MKKIILGLGIALGLATPSVSNAGFIWGGCASLSESGNSIWINCSYDPDEICMTLGRDQNGKWILECPAYGKSWELLSGHSTVNQIPIEQADQILDGNVGGSYIIQK